MKKIRILLGTVMMVLGLSMFQPALPMAHEHAGKEHGGEETAEKEHGGEGMFSEEDIATLREAAAALTASHPELAKKLEKMAEAHAG